MEYVHLSHASLLFVVSVKLDVKAQGWILGKVKAVFQKIFVSPYLNLK